MLEIVCRVIGIIVKCECAQKFIEVLMESDAAVQEDLEHVIKVSLQAIDCELDDFEN